jgi:hypothetical protein
MFELIYYSEANSNLSSDDLSDILEKSREFNLKHKITGCLLHHNKEFLQILEGEKGIIKDLYSVIKKDNRHTNILLLSEGNKKKRLFPNWSMGFQNLDNINLEKNNFTEDIVSFSELTNKTTHDVILYWTMAKNNFIDI